MKKLLMVFMLLTNFLLNAEELLLYGGDNHQDFLGCINCSAFNGNSICNDFGSHGNSFSSESIWQPFATYGNSFSSSSPWNSFSANAPVIVDKSGGFYGYFTVNKSHPKRTTIKLLEHFLNNFEKFNDLTEARDWLCKQLN